MLELLTMGIALWEILGEEEVSPSPWFKVFRRKYRMPNGNIVDDFYVSKLGDVATVVVKTEKNEVVMVKQYKPGFGEIMLELPAGRLKKGQTPEVAARVELLEETGIEVGDLVELGRVSEMPTKDPMAVYIFYAKNIIKLGEKKLDKTEDIEVVLVPEEKIDEMIKNGEIIGTSAVTALYLAKVSGYLK